MRVRRLQALDGAKASMHTGLMKVLFSVGNN